MSKPLKVGLMVAIDNTTMERELTSWLPAGTQCITLRIARGKGMLTSEAIPAYKAQALKLAEEFKGHDIDSLDAPDVGALGHITGPEVEAISRRTMTPDSRALFIACSQLPTYEILGGLGREFGRPVLSSIQSTAWQVRRTLGLTS